MDFGSNERKPDCLPNSPTAVTEWKPLPLTSCSTRESGPSTSPGQCGRAGPESAGMGKPTLEDLKAREPALPLAHLYKDALYKGNVGEPILMAKTGALAG